MAQARLRWLLGACILLVCWVAVREVRAGGSGLNTVVIANQNSSNSCALANYYCERRGVPPQNVLRIAWPGGNISWISDELQSYLVQPLLQMVTCRGLTNQVGYIVLSMDIPFETVNSADGTVNSTTSALFYGVRSSGGSVVNSYAFSEAVFNQPPPTGSPAYSFLTAMITGNSLSDAEQVVDQGVASDGAFPSRSVVLAKSSDPIRNIRYFAFDNAIFNVDICGVSAIFRTNSDVLPGPGPFLGYETGLATYSVPSGAFAPGAMADSLTSYGGMIFGANGQTSLLAMLQAGAAGSYGTVSEPGTDTEKFPDPETYFYQARGFSLAESYFQSVSIPYLGLVAGEPLAAPFRQLAQGGWLATNTVLRGTVELPMVFFASDAAHPLQQVDLFVDGTYYGTLDSLAPSAGNVLSVLLNGYPVSYTIPASATLGSVASGLAAALNAPAVTNATKVTAYAYGDRIELHSATTNSLADPFFYTDSTATNAAAPAYMAVYLPVSFPPRLSVPGRDRQGAPKLRVETLPGMPFVILGSSNLADWFPLASWPAGGPADFVDPEEVQQPRRFYRVSGASADQWLGPGLPPSTAPAVTVLSGPGSNGCLLRVSGTVWPYLIESSTNSTQWTPLFTNLDVGQIQVAVANSAGSAASLTTTLVPSRTTFLTSSAYGFRQYKVPGSSPQVGAWLQFTFTKTNGTVVVVGITNQVSGTSSTALAAQLCNLINTNGALQSADGVVAEDFYVNTANLASFNLRARTPAVAAAAILVAPARSGLIILPSTASTLAQNLSDLQPRNHLYVTTGSSALNFAAELDTTFLADGFHELRAVAYEGSNVRTETPISLSVQVTNSPLAATLTLLDLTNGAPSGATYHAQVAANTNTVTLIRLFSTGGLLSAVTNQSLATLSFDASILGAGLHPFYALVDTANGAEYRTQEQSIRLSQGP